MESYQSKKQIENEVKKAKRDEIRERLKTLFFIKSHQKQELDQPFRDRSKTQDIQIKSYLSLEQTQSEAQIRFESLYKIDKKLGQGMHSVVYNCIEKQTQKTYAVKVNKSIYQELLIMIQRSFSLMRSLKHPSIIVAQKFFRDSQRQICYTVMEKVNYPSMRAYLQKFFEIGVDESILKKIISEIMKAVQYLHEIRVCHRDLKPQNILYNPATNQIKIIDFELACQQKITDQKLEMWTNTGSLYYRAPESFEGVYDQKIDVWAIGVIAYQLFIGKLPFKQQFTLETIQNIKTASLKNQQKLMKASQSLKGFILKALQKDPEKRLSINQLFELDFFTIDTNIFQ